MFRADTRRYRDIAFCTLQHENTSATAPAGWEVVSNARVASRPDAGTAGRWAFEPTEPISTYISALVAGPYHRVAARHGDVILNRVALDIQGAPQDLIVLAEGEVTGHAHRLSPGEGGTVALVELNTGSPTTQGEASTLIGMLRSNALLIADALG